MANLEYRSHPFANIPVQLETLLKRPPAQFDKEELKSLLAHRTVLITGAGGSIGRELSWQVAQLQPERLILLDFSEFNLFHLEYTLQSLPSPCSISYELIDIRDTSLIESMIETSMPDVVFHAAAYKHVPMMEQHPLAALQNNTLATINLLHISERYDVEQFIFISTDKAVEPLSIMGTTKRLTEWYVRAANGVVKTKTVRFGNVFGSLGSVVPLFAEQIQNGGPITITEPEMERFFMSVHDACSLILQTLLFNVAPVYTLRMDPPIKITWLAEQMIKLLSPHTPIPIKYVGIRNGEKVREQLWASDESLIQTSHRDILGLTSPAHYSRSELDEWLLYLKQLSSTRQIEKLRTALFQKDLVVARS